MGKRKRRAFTNELKAETVRIVRDRGKSVGAIARELDLDRDGTSRLRCGRQRSMPAAGPRAR